MAWSGQHIDEVAYVRDVSMPDGSRARARLLHVARQNPLLETRPSLAALRAVPSRRPHAIFAGIGLVSGQRVSEALPLDVLGILLGAEAVRRAAEAERLVVMVADQHAIEKGAEESAVRRCAEHYDGALRRVAERCGFSHMQVIRASQLDAQDDFRTVLSEVKRRVPEGTDAYLTRELADIAYLRRRHPGLIKVGWALKPSAVNADRDERVFDVSYQRWMGDRAVFLYTKSGRVFDDRRRKGPPYVTRDVDRRLCLQADENVRAKLERNRDRVSECTYRGVCNHLRAITRTYSRLVRPLSGSLSVRTQTMLDQIMGPDGVHARR